MTNSSLPLSWSNNESSFQQWSNVDINSRSWSHNDTGLERTSVLYYGVNGYEITWVYFLTHVLLILVAGSGIFLNTVALKIVCVKSPFNDASHNFISHLAMSDIFNGIICMYVVLYNLVHYKNYYECALRTGLATCINLNSSIHLLSLTFDRYFKIMHPYKYVQYFSNEKRMKIFSRCVWMFACVLGLLPILGWRRPPVHGTQYCSYFGVLERNYLKLMCGLFFTILFTMLYCYISIICVAWNQRRRVINTSKNKKTAYDHRNTKALWWAPTKTVIILISFYSCCWLPTAVVILLHLSNVFPISYTDDRKGVILAYTSSFVFLNIIANPIIYAFKIRRVKSRVRTMINNISSEARLRPHKPSQDSGCREPIALSELLKATVRNQSDSKVFVLTNKSMSTSMNV